MNYSIMNKRGTACRSKPAREKIKGFYLPCEIKLTANIIFKYKKESEALRFANKLKNLAKNEEAKINIKFIKVK